MGLFQALKKDWFGAVRSGQVLASSGVLGSGVCMAWTGMESIASSFWL